MKTLYSSPKAELLSLPQEDILSFSDIFDNIKGDDFDLMGGSGE